MKDFLFTLFAWLLTLPFIIGAVTFALYNQDSTPITVNPFLGAIPMPLYVPVLTAIGIGFLFGTIMTWAGMGRLRRQKRELAKRIKILEKQSHTANNNHVVPFNYSQVAANFVDKQ